MKIILVQSDYGNDWYTIQRADHEGRAWLEEVHKGCLALMCSERLSPESCIEGDAFDMIELARCILKKEDCESTRCAVMFEGEFVYFWSPRNSLHKTPVGIDDATEFAHSVLTQLITGYRHEI